MPCPKAAHIKGSAGSWTQTCSSAVAGERVWDAHRDADAADLSRWHFQGSQQAFAFSCHVSSCVREPVQRHTPAHVVTRSMSQELDGLWSIAFPSLQLEADALALNSGLLHPGVYLA